MFFLQINEFSPALMAKAATALNAKHLMRLLELQHTRTETTDKEERFGLDPWVQWVSIHTGQPSTVHGVGHLGDVPQLCFPQIWEVLDKQGLSSGVWGAMNARRGMAKNNVFFFPDPWTFSEHASPAMLNDLLALPRYFSKNYGDLSTKKLLTHSLRLLRFCLRPSMMRTLLPLTPKFLSTVLRHGVPEYLLFSLFDLVNAHLFVRFYKDKSPDFSLLFLNSLAHLQHHKWMDNESLSKEMLIAFDLFDSTLGVLFGGLQKEQQWLIANAFSQTCTSEKNEYLYRQKNPEKFLSSVGISFEKVEQAMTNDGHVFFDSADAAQAAAGALRAATINGRPAFHVEHNSAYPDKIFYQFIIWDPLPENTIICINERALLFYELFEKITKRTGSHISTGDIFAKGLELPAVIANHEIHNHILNAFAKRI